NSCRYLSEQVIGFLRASRRRGFFEKLPKLSMGLYERSKTSLPQYVRQAGVTVELVIALDEAEALPDHNIRQEAEIDVLNRRVMNRIVCVVTVPHDVHRFTPQ